MKHYKIPPDISFETKEIQIGDYNLTYWEEGLEFKGKRPTIYFLHGWTGDIYDYVWQVEYFSSKFHVMIHNHRSHGTSTSRDEPVTMKDLAEDFYQILKKKEISDFILMGHSMGSFVSLELVLAHQDLVKALVLCGAASRMTLPPGVEDLIGKFDSMYEIQHLLANWFDIPLRKRPQEDRDFYARLYKWELDQKKGLPLHVATRFIEGFKQYDVTNRLKEIQVPTLILYGEQDIMVSQKDNTPILQAIPNSEVVLIEGSGHSPTREQIDATNAVLEEFFNRFG